MERWIHQFRPAGIESVINYCLSFCSLIRFRASSSSLPACRHACSLMREDNLSDQLLVSKENMYIYILYKSTEAAMFAQLLQKNSDSHLWIFINSKEKACSYTSLAVFSRIVDLKNNMTFSQQELYIRGFLHRSANTKTTQSIVFHILNLLAGVSSSSSGQLLLAVGSLLDDQHWHHVKLQRLSTHLNLTVDKNTRQVHTPAELIHWDINQVR